MEGTRIAGWLSHAKNSQSNGERRQYEKCQQKEIKRDITCSKGTIYLPYLLSNLGEVPRFQAVLEVPLDGSIVLGRSKLQEVKSPLLAGLFSDLLINLDCKSWLQTLISNLKHVS